MIVAPASCLCDSFSTGPVSRFAQVPRAGPGLPGSNVAPSLPISSVSGDPMASSHRLSPGNPTRLLRETKLAHVTHFHLGLASHAVVQAPPKLYFLYLL